MANRAAVLGPLHRVLLHQHPAVAALLERLDELVADVRVVGQGHLGRGEPSHAAEGLEAEDRGEVMLPGPDVQAIILHRRRGGHRMTPRRTEPLDAPAVRGIARDGPEAVEHVVQSHRAQAVKQAAGVIEHHPRLFPFADQLGDELAHPLVALVKDGGVVVVPDVRMVHHVLEIADDRRRSQIVGPGGNQRLVHVQRDGERALDAIKVNPALAEIKRARPGRCLVDQVL